MATEKDVLINEIIWDDGDASKKADVWNDKLQKSEQSSHALADAFFKISEALIEFSVNAGRDFAKFEEDLSHARRTMNLSREETLMLGDSLIDLAANFGEAGLKAGVSANELAKIAGILGQLGISAQFVGQEAFENLTVTTAKLSVAFGMSSGKAAEFLGILSNLYDLPVGELENVASSVTVLGNSTVATAQQILDIMQRIGGVGGLLGVTAQEAAALAATVREAGVSTQVGGTALSQVFSRLASDVDKFAEVLGKGGLRESMLRFQLESGNATDALKSVLQAIQNINASQGKIAAAQALKDLGLTGVRVQQTLLALSNNLGGLNKNLAISEQAYRENIAVNDAYQAAIDNTSQKWTQFKNLLNIITKVIGKDLALAFGDFLDNHLIPFTRRFSEWLDTSKGAEAIFGREGMLAKGLDWIGQKLSDNADWLFEWLDTIDVHLPAAVTALKQTFYAYFDQMDIGLRDVLEGYKSFKETLINSKRAWEDLSNTARFFWEELTKTREWLVNILEALINFGGKGKGIFMDLYEQLKPIDDFIAKIGWGLVNLSNKLIDLIPGMRQVEEEAYGQSLFPKLVEWTYRAEKRVLQLNKALNETGRAMASISSGLNFQGLDMDTLLSLARSTGIFDASGILGLIQLARANQLPISQQTGAGTSAQGAGYAGQQSAIPLTLVIEGAETARLAAVMRAEDLAYEQQLTSGFGH